MTDPSGIAGELRRSFEQPGGWRDLIAPVVRGGAAALEVAYATLEEVLVERSGESDPEPALCYATLLLCSFDAGYAEPEREACLATRKWLRLAKAWGAHSEDLRLLLGWLCIHEGSLAEAYVRLERVAALPAARFRLGLLELARDRADPDGAASRALAHYRIGLEGPKGDLGAADCQAGCAQAYLILGQTQRAREALVLARQRGALHPLADAVASALAREESRSGRRARVAAALALAGAGVAAAFGLANAPLWREGAQAEPSQPKSSTAAAMSESR